MVAVIVQQAHFTLVGEEPDLLLGQPHAIINEGEHRRALGSTMDQLDPDLAVIMAKLADALCITAYFELDGPR